MWVKLKYKTINGKCYACRKELTVKQATKYFEEHLKNDKEIVKVWLNHFDGWHTYLHKILKGRDIK